jgi:hypothetical protein
MRGADSKQEGMFCYVSPEARIPARHPLRPIRAMVAEALVPLDQRTRSDSLASGGNARLRQLSRGD